MKIKRFVANNMRAALIQVKEDLGADAVILSNKKIPDGIEIVAAMDYDASAFHKKVKTQKSPVNNQPVFPSKMIDDSITKISKSNNDEIKDDTAEEIDSLSALLERQQSKRKQQQNKPQQKSVKLPKWAQDLAEIKTPKNAKKEAPVINNNKIEFPKELRSESKVSKNDDISAIKNEIHSLKNILIFQCSNLLSQEKHRRDPVRATLESRLIQGGFSRKISSKLAALSQKYNPFELSKILPKVLATSIANPVDDVINQGGIFALVGSTGVGKTTTIAKLAARFLIKNESQDLLLLSTDHYRIGAFEQLSTYGKIMGCQVKKVKDDTEFKDVIEQCKTKKLVLIDTPGMGQRDRRLYKQLDALATDTGQKIHNYLVLAATSQQQVIEDAVTHFKRIPIAGTIVTKLDEAISTAELISVLIHHQLKVFYTTNGQRVPEDLKVADPLELVNQALDAMDSANTSILTSNLWASDLNHASE